MNPIHFLPFFSLLLLLAPSNGNAAGSLLRIACDGDDVGAEISINGEFKGECPLDIQVSPGTLKISLIKKIDASQERTFEQEIRIGGGVVKKVEAVLSAPHLNAVAQKQENDRLRVERAAAAKREAERKIEMAEEQRKDEELLVQQQRAAGTGDNVAMLALGDRYASGKGLDKNASEANAWYSKAAAAGNALAAFKLSDQYKKGKKQEVDAVLRILRLPIEQERNVSIEGAEKIRAFVASDPFFEVPGGDQKATYSFKKIFGADSRTMHTSVTCGRESKFFQVVYKNESQDFSNTAEVFGALGGLIALETKSSSGFFSRIPSSRSEMTRIEKLHGQPFPLTAGKRFGMTFVTKESDGNYPQYLTCAIDGEVGKKPGRQLHCLTQFHSKYGYYSNVNHSSWDEASGCFKSFVVK